MTMKAEVHLNVFIATMTRVADEYRAAGRERPSLTHHLKLWFEEADVNLYDPVVRRAVWSVVGVMGATNLLDEKEILLWSLFLTSLDQEV